MSFIFKQTSRYNENTFITLTVVSFHAPDHVPLVWSFYIKRLRQETSNIRPWFTWSFQRNLLFLT